jgi:hypothetical protein
VVGSHRSPFRWEPADEPFSGIPSVRERSPFFGALGRQKWVESVGFARLVRQSISGFGWRDLGVVPFGGESLGGLGKRPDVRGLWTR